MFAGLPTLEICITFDCFANMLKIYGANSYTYLRTFNNININQIASFSIDRKNYAVQKKSKPLLCPNSFVPQKRFASTEIAQQSWFGGIWQTLSNSTPVAYMQQGLAELHDFTGLPWWATIVLSTVLLRSVITLPLTIYQHKITARIEKLALELPAIVEELKKEAAIAMKKFNWSEQQTRVVYQRSLKKQWNNLIVRDNCHPAKTFIVLWAQIPLWIFQSVAIRNLVYMLPDATSIEAKLIFTELTVGGFAWIPNLTEVDSSYILPVALGLINLGIVELQTILRTKSPTRFQNIMTNVFRGLSLLMVPIATTVPAALCVYWVTSSTYGLVQNLLLATPAVRRVFRIPQTKSELLNPYERIWTALKLRTGQMEATAIAANESNAAAIKETNLDKPENKINSTTFKRKS